MHINLHKIEATCKALGVEYVTVVNGFERKQGRAVPVRNGVLVLAEMQHTVEEAHHAMEIEREKKKALQKKKTAIRNWRRLMSCYKTKIYVEETYNNSDSAEEDIAEAGRPSRDGGGASSRTSGKIQDRVSSSTKPKTFSSRSNRVYMLGEREKLNDAGAKMLDLRFC